jgi:hypothetical protein
MPAKGTTTGNKRNWLRAIAIGLNVIGHDASNDSVTYWLKSGDGRRAWSDFAKELPHPGTLRNYYTEARSKTTDDDRPWSIGQTASGNAGDVIPVDALPFVLMVWLRTRVGNRTLTVRQARWCAKLFRFYTMGEAVDPAAGDLAIQTIYGVATMYSAREQQAEKNQNRLGADTGDLDAILAFGLATTFGGAAGSGAQSGLDIAIKLGLVSRLNSDTSKSAQIDDEPTRVIREWIVEAIHSQTSDLPKGHNPARISYWASVYVSLGVQALLVSDGWNALDDSKRQERAIEMGKAINNEDWTIYEKLTSQIGSVDLAVDHGESHE